MLPKVRETCENADYFPISGRRTQKKPLSTSHLRCSGAGERRTSCGGLFSPEKKTEGTFEKGGGGVTQTSGGENPTFPQCRGRGGGGKNHNPDADQEKKSENKRGAYIFVLKEDP